MKANLTKPIAVLAAFAACAMTFGSCAKRTGPVAKILNASGTESIAMESSEAPVISSNAAISSSMPAPISSKTAAPLKSESAFSIAAGKKAASSCGSAGPFFIRRAADPQPIVKGWPGIQPGGPIQVPYYRYNHSYYQDIGTVDSIQNNIESRLSGDFYKIKGVDSQKSVAMFINQHYHELDYVFPDSITYNDKNYLINSNKIIPDDKSFGQAGGDNLYRLKGFDPSIELGVEIVPGYVSTAFQLESTVTLNGTLYQVEPLLGKIPKGEKLKALGKAHGETAAYDAYSAGGESNDGVIVLYVNNTYETTAVAISSTAGRPLPKSYSGTPFESMFIVQEMVQWPGHGCYYVNSHSVDQKYNSDAAQAAIKNQLGAFLDNYKPDANNSYPMYAIKGINPAKKIMVQNNQVYLVYDFIFPDTVTYNGHLYQIGDENAAFLGVKCAIRGKSIGMAGKYKAFAIQNVDPSKAIIVEMCGNTECGEISGGTMMAYRVN